ncbi:MAG: hypothetical protein HQK74_09800 [Desulfamplus sp.]|nr:hypothetical protein [Desulfamplus sp.]
MQIKKYSKVISHNFVHSILIALFAIFGVICNQTIAFAEPPTVTISTSATESIELGYSAIFWANVALDDESKTVRSYLWFSNIQGELSTEKSFSTTTTPLIVGLHTITLLVTDSAGETNDIASSDSSISIQVTPVSPTVLITVPFNNSSHVLGKEITFEGSGIDTEDGDLTENSLKWTSDLIGFLGYGTPLILTTLPIGTHNITLTATNSRGKSNSNTITITVVEATLTPPIVTIITPANNSTFIFGIDINFEAIAENPIVDEGNAGEEGEVEVIENTFKWTSNISGFLGSGASITVSKLAIETHTITLTVTNSKGATATATLTITVKNALPTVEILSPSDGAKFNLNEYIRFSGEASDNTDGVLRGSSLVWRSNRVAESLGTGNQISTNALALGDHLITLTATNSAGVAITNFIVIKITESPSTPATPNSPPTPFINAPVDNSTFNDTDSIRFAGHAEDIEDGILSGSSLSWVSDIDGYIGSGVQFSQSLSPGEHSITLAAKDNDEATGYATITITVNQTKPEEPLTLENVELSIPLGQVYEMPVTGGHPPYRYYRDYPYIASMTILGKTIKIVPQTIGSTTFKIVDRYNNTATLSLTVTDAGSDQDVYPEGVTSFYTFDKEKTLGLKVVGDGELVYINPKPSEFILDNNNRPENMLYGVIDLKLKVKEGDSANLIVYFPEPLKDGVTAYKYSPVDSKGWYDYSDFITVSSDRTKAYLTLMDGGPGDDDGKVDGIISDPIAFGEKPKTTSETINPPQSSDDGGGGGGCFISTLFE